MTTLSRRFMLLALAVIIVFSPIGLTHSSLYAQGRSLTPTQLEAIVKTDLEKCSAQNNLLKSGRLDPAAIIPTKNAKEFPTDKIAKTLNGVWRGRVLGDDKDTSVDYFWIMDTKRSEGLIIAQRNGKDSTGGMQPVANAPKLTYLMCAHEGYIPSKDSPQVHEFTKVSNSTANAAKIIEKATGLKLKKANPTLSDLWQGLLAKKYFDHLPVIAYAGGFFKPIQITRAANAVGPAGVSVKWNGEYMGGGSTSVQFKPGVPIRGVEYAQFVGTATKAGNFLVASPGNGKLWKVEAVSGSSYDLAFDQVTIGPLE